MKSGQLGRSYFVTVMNTAIGTVVGVTMMSMYAYAISRKDVKYAGFFSLFAYITFVFNGGLVPFYFVYSRVLGLTNTLWVMIIPYLVDVWYIVILKTYFANSIPHEVFESATIDGAGEIRIFVKIILPLAMPAIATVILFTVLKYWNDFQLPLYFIEESKLYNVQYMLYRIMANMEFISQDTRSIRLEGPLPVESARMAMCVLGAGPLLVAYPFFQRYFVKGLTMGSVKG
jgi:putative aldouronate transport system permease protein